MLVVPVLARGGAAPSGFVGEAGKWQAAAQALQPSALLDLRDAVRAAPEPVGRRSPNTPPEH